MFHVFEIADTIRDSPLKVVPVEVQVLQMGVLEYVVGESALEVVVVQVQHDCGRVVDQRLWDGARNHVFADIELLQVQPSADEAVKLSVERVVVHVEGFNAGHVFEQSHVAGQSCVVVQREERQVLQVLNARRNVAMETVVA